MSEKTNSHWHRTHKSYRYKLQYTHVWRKQNTSSHSEYEDIINVENAKAE